MKTTNWRRPQDAGLSGTTTEFRKDVVSGEWVLMSTGIQKKPVFFAAPESKAFPKSKCPFEDLERSGHEKILLWLPRPGKHEKKDWWVEIVPNRYPVVSRLSTCPPLIKNGIYHKKMGVGFQELVVTKDHFRHIGSMVRQEIELLLEAYSTRFWALREEPCVEYILIIHNHGTRAGATVPHPHSQIFAIPIVPPDVSRSIFGSRKYFHKNKRCVHCDMIRWETKKKERLIYQNDLFIALAPYASRVSFEVRIFPKKHEARFEIIDRAQREKLADAMKFVFGGIQKKMHDPDYNFFIHTSPPKEVHDGHYHWHMEILPRVSTWGGLELGTGIEVVKTLPEETAKLLRK